MRILFASTYDAHGGAARAAERIFRGVGGMETARMVVKSGTGDDPAVVCAAGKSVTPWQRRWHRLACRLGLRPKRPALPPGLSSTPDPIESADLAGEIASFAPDLVHLHWICNDFLSLEEIAALRHPVVWTLHDSWPFTGGCHVPGECLRYRQSCGACPLLPGKGDNDWSSRLLERKRECYAGLALTVVAPSRWLAAAARSSSILSGVRVEVIPNGLDVSRFRPLGRTVARAILGLPAERPLILFGGMSSTTDPNKGFSLLLQALELGGAEGTGAALAVFGASRGELPTDFPLPVHFLGTLRDDAALALAYSAADVMVVPSKQEAFCQTASEAMSCGVPVVCFRGSGLLDIVEHGVNGYAATPYDPAELWRGIVWSLDPARAPQLSRNARFTAVTKFSLEVVARQYRDLYRQIVGGITCA